MDHSHPIIVRNRTKSCMNYNQGDGDPQGGGAPAESDRDGGLRSDKLRGAIGLLRRPLDAQGLGSWGSRIRKERTGIRMRETRKACISGDKQGLRLLESDLGVGTEELRTIGIQGTTFESPPFGSSGSFEDEGRSSNSFHSQPTLPAKRGGSERDI